LARADDQSVLVQWQAFPHFAVVQACVFDAYGTLFDFAAAARKVLGDDTRFITLWRDINAMTGKIVDIIPETQPQTSGQK